MPVVAAAAKDREDDRPDGNTSTADTVDFDDDYYGNDDQDHDGGYVPELNTQQEEIAVVEENQGQNQVGDEKEGETKNTGEQADGEQADEEQEEDASRPNILEETGREQAASIISNCVGSCQDTTGADRQNESNDDDGDKKKRSDTTTDVAASSSSVTEAAGMAEEATPILVTPTTVLRKKRRIATKATGSNCRHRRSSTLRTTTTTPETTTATLTPAVTTTVAAPQIGTETNETRVNDDSPGLDGHTDEAEESINDHVEQQHEEDENEKNNHDEADAVSDSVGRQHEQDKNEKNICDKEQEEQEEEKHPKRTEKMTAQFQQRRSLRHDIQYTTTAAAALAGKRHRDYSTRAKSTKTQQQVSRSSCRKRVQTNRYGYADDKAMDNKEDEDEQDDEDEEDAYSVSDEEDVGQKDDDDRHQKRSRQTRKKSNRQQSSTAHSSVGDSSVDTHDDEGEEEEEEEEKEEEEYISPLNSSIRKRIRKHCFYIGRAGTEITKQKQQKKRPGRVLTPPNTEKISRRAKSRTVHSSIKSHEVPYSKRTSGRKKIPTNRFGYNKDGEVLGKDGDESESDSSTEEQNWIEESDSAGNEGSENEDKESVALLGRRVSVLFPDNVRYPGVIEKEKTDGAVEIFVRYDDKTESWVNMLTDRVRPWGKPNRSGTSLASSSPSLDPDDSDNEKSETAAGTTSSAGERPKRSCRDHKLVRYVDEVLLELKTKHQAKGTTKAVSQGKVAKRKISMHGQGNLDDASVGDSVRVWWPIERKFYHALVKKRRGVKKMIYVSFDDGDEKWINPDTWDVRFYDEKGVLLSPPPTTTTAKCAPAATQQSAVPRGRKRKIPDQEVERCGCAVKAPCMQSQVPTENAASNPEERLQRKRQHATQNLVTPDSLSTTKAVHGKRANLLASRRPRKTALGESPSDGKLAEQGSRPRDTETQEVEYSSTENDLADDGQEFHAEVSSDGDQIETVSNLDDSQQIIQMISVGSEVKVYWKAEKKAFEGVVTRAWDQLIQVRYKDGDLKWSDLATENVKVLSSPGPAVSAEVGTGRTRESKDATPFGLNSRIDIHWDEDDAYFGGIVTKVDRVSGEVFVEYDEAEHQDEWVDLKTRKHRPGLDYTEPELLDKIKRGDMIEIWWPLEKKFFPGTVIQKNNKNGKRFIDYDDGDEGWVDLKIRAFNFVGYVKVEEDVTGFSWSALEQQEELDSSDTRSVGASSSDDPDYVRPEDRTEFNRDGKRYSVGEWYYCRKDESYYKILKFGGKRNVTNVECEVILPMNSTFVGEGPRKGKRKMKNIYVQCLETLKAKISSLKDVQEYKRKPPKPKYFYKEVRGDSQGLRFCTFIHTEVPSSTIALPPDCELTAADAFGGAGGMSIGIQNAGFIVSHVFEKNGMAASILKQKHPAAEIFQEDITSVLNRIEKKVDGYPTFVYHYHASPPCQGYSGLNRGGSDDEENNSLTECFVWGVKALNACTATFENVCGILHKKHESKVKNILNQLLEMGYNARLCIHDASDYGDPQVRKRVFIYAAKACLPFMPMPTKWKGTKRTVESAIRDLEDIPLDKDGPGMVILRENGNQTKTWNHVEFTSDNENVFRLKGDEAVHTLTTQIVLAHYEKDRNLSLRELARLQSFPDDLQFFGSPNQIRRQIGNAVPVMLATAVMQAVMQTYVDYRKITSKTSSRQEQSSLIVDTSKKHAKLL